jgi:hypothetical protein
LGRFWIITVNGLTIVFVILWCSGQTRDVGDISSSRGHLLYCVSTLFSESLVVGPSAAICGWSLREALTSPLE